MNNNNNCDNNRIRPEIKRYRVAKRLKTWDLRKFKNIKNITKLHEIIA